MHRMVKITQKLLQSPGSIDPLYVGMVDVECLCRHLRQPGSFMDTSRKSWFSLPLYHKSIGHFQILAEHFIQAVCIWHVSPR